VKKLLLSFGTVLLLIPSLLALPLTVLVFQESAKLDKKFTAWNKQCGNKPDYDETCSKRRRALSAELGQFVALVNDELAGLRDISPDASSDFVIESNGRRKIMEHEIRVAFYRIKCLGAAANDPQCHAESVAINKETESLAAEYKKTHAAFDGTWVPLHVSVSPAPRKP
jgi:hypothetical protein